MKLKSVVVLALLGLSSTPSKADDNIDFINEMTPIQRMLSCSKAHGSWEMNAPTREQADEHRLYSNKVWESAVDKYGYGAVVRSSMSPKVMALGMVAMNRQSLTLEKHLCRGFGDHKQALTIEKVVGPNVVKTQQEPTHDTPETIDEISRASVLMARNLEYSEIQEVVFEQDSDTNLRLMMCFQIAKNNGDGSREAKIQNTLESFWRGYGVLPGNEESDVAYDGMDEALSATNIHMFVKAKAKGYPGKFLDKFCG